MNGRRPTKIEMEWLDKITEMGCLICKLDLDTYTPAEVHHLEGCRKTGAHLKTLPLCPTHHRLPVDDHIAVSIHANKKEFRRRYGNEYDLLEKVKELV